VAVAIGATLRERAMSVLPQRWSVGQVVTTTPTTPTRG
jgi:hypothetical protein